ncbi:MAG: cysteine--tRNA ligase [Acidimicrobiales bacterium]
MQLYDTATRQVAPLPQRNPGKVSIYVCGPTVYAPPHIGHGRQVLVYDVLCRFLEWSGLEVDYVSNITDIDDQIIERAKQENRDPADIARKCERVWWEAMDRLNARRPGRTPHATEYVEEMVELIGELIEAGKAYQTSDGVYLSVEQVDDYGMLPRQDLDNLLEGGGERAIVGDEKRHPADFVLWKLAKEGEPFWPSPWGDGRPGWHTECVVMSLDLLGEGFDLHAGGPDLIFPHHENERAQAVALGLRFAEHWMHHGFVELQGEKMSKSLGNVKNLLDLTEQYDPRCYRLLLLQSHYRSPIEVTDETITASAAALDRLDSFARRTSGLSGSPSDEVLEGFRTAMENDLDTAGAVDLMFRLVREANTALDGGDESAAGVAAAGAFEIASALGLELNRESADVPAEILRMAEDRTAARDAKDYARADDLRDRMAAAGWTVEDSADGPVVLPLG